MRTFFLRSPFLSSAVAVRIYFFLFRPKILSNKTDCRLWFIEMIFRFLHTKSINSYMNMIRMGCPWLCLPHLHPPIPPTRALVSGQKGLRHKLSQGINPEYRLWFNVRFGCALVCHRYQNDHFKSTHYDTVRIPNVMLTVRWWVDLVLGTTGTSILKFQDRMARGFEKPIKIQLKHVMLFLRQCSVIENNFKWLKLMRNTRLHAIKYAARTSRDAAPSVHVEELRIGYCWWWWWLIIHVMMML